MDKGGRDGTCVADRESCTSCGHCASKKGGTVGKIIDIGASRIGTSIGIGAKGFDSNLASMIDHTLLKPDATKDELTKLCNEAKQYNFATCCVNSSNIPFVARLLKGSSVKPIAVVGFPLGAASTNAKVCEARDSIAAGAREIDMVINIGALKSRDYRAVYDDIKAVVDASRPYKVKVILETSSLDRDEKVAACVLSKSAGAAFVKTSTGFAGGGATVEDIMLMRKIVGGDMEVKASGGIRTKEDAEKMVAAGADRIGASASIAIVTGAAQEKKASGKY
ncbi:MAG: deoxyribose-phosphate aldolase [Deltaproteobacteria bacterium]|nr:deoxyribose-phosphate aldolase [Deltaproteobacteria bacterium]